MKIWSKVQGFVNNRYASQEHAREGETIDYNIYHLSVSEKLRYTFEAGLFLFLLGIIFFDNKVIAVIFSLLAPLYPKYKLKEIIRKRKSELNLQFRDALYSLSSALNAGFSLENCFKAALKDLGFIYHDGEAYILKELELITRRLQLNIPIEDCLRDLAKRSGLEDISNFVNIVVICKKTGGNLIDVVTNSSAIISEKIEICNDIELLLTRQKFEQKILNLMPAVFIGILRFGSSGYMNPLYSSVKGYFLMALALLIIIFAIFISRKILDIRV